jgi:hypothetical protein
MRVIDGDISLEGVGRPIKETVKGAPYARFSEVPTRYKLAGVRRMQAF